MDQVTATVFFDGRPAGELTRSPTGYRFRYLDAYLTDPATCPVSYTLPLTSQVYQSERLFPCFEGLVSEGWLLHQQCRTQRIDETNYFSLLVRNGEDLSGAVTLKLQSTTAKAEDAGSRQT